MMIIMSWLWWRIDTDDDGEDNDVGDCDDDDINDDIDDDDDDDSGQISIDVILEFFYNCTYILQS